MLSTAEISPRASAAASPPTDMANSSTQPALSAPLMNNENQAEHSGDTLLETNPARETHELQAFLRRKSSTVSSIATSLIVNTEEKLARSTTAVDAPSVTSATHIRWQGAPSRPSVPMGNSMNIVEVIVLSILAPARLCKRDYTRIQRRPRREKMMRRRMRLLAAGPNFWSFFTRSTVKQSQNGATWRQVFNLTLNSGFGSGAPTRLEKYVGVREGRELARYLPGESGVGRAGKDTASVPAAMIKILRLRSRKSFLKDAKRQLKEFVDEIDELDRTVD